MKITFERVKYIHKFKDAEGRRKQKVFWQSLNPFNKNKDGSLKTREDIMIELKSMGKQWEYVERNKKN